MLGRETDIILLALIAAIASPASTQQVPVSARSVAGAWVMEQQKCSSGTLVVYLEDGRAYATLGRTGFGSEGRYTLTGNILTENFRTAPANRSNPPTKYDMQVLTERRLITRMTRDRMDLNYPGNRNPDLTTPSMKRCPETGGVEPWFPRVRYRGFAVERGKIPGRSGGASPPPAGPAGPVASGLANLDGFFQFRSAIDCDPAGPFRALLDGMVLYPESDALGRAHFGRITVPSAYRAAVGRPATRDTKDGLLVRLPIKGTWRGIPVVGIEAFYLHGRDPRTFGILLRAPRSTVLAMLNRQGFRIPASGVRTNDDGYESEVGVTMEGRDVKFYCG